MSRHLNPFQPPEHAVLSLEVQAQMPDTRRGQDRFEVLVRHLLDRFLNNELMSSDGETARALQLAYAIALPGLVVALYLFAPYHAPGKRPFWLQVNDHYFYVTYSMIVMGMVTVYEWDLLFPDLLDVFVLSVLPMKAAKLFLARILALAIFFVLVLLGTNSLGAIFFPFAADLPSPAAHLFAHASAVILGGVFTACIFLSIQAVLLNFLGEQIFRRITPILQCAAITVLLTVLFLCPAISHFLQALLRSDSTIVRYFPPFWFLGIYERLLQGPSTLPVFKALARSGYLATLLTVGLVILTYPLAYRRRVRQLIEGSDATSMRNVVAELISRLLHVTALRGSARRAIFHFIGQTVMRMPKQRVLMAMYAGLAIAIALSEILLLTISREHVHFGVVSHGIRTAVPIMAFWTVVGLRTALAAPVDRRGSWIFSLIAGRPGLEHLKGAKIWVVLCAFFISIATVTALHTVAPQSLRLPLATAGQIIVAVGLSLLLTDCLYRKTMAIPFTHLRKLAFTEMPWAVVRYFVLFPVLVVMTVHYEAWIEASIVHLVVISLMIGLLHLVLRWEYGQRVREMRMSSDFENEEELFQRLGLSD